MVVIGVTGGVGTGKSTVAKMFEALGAVVYDADVIAHELMQPKRTAWQAIVRAFGRTILKSDHTVDRQRLAAIVFNNTARRRALERILHPRVIRYLQQQRRRLARAGRVPAVVFDVPLLLEAGARHVVDTLVVVSAPPAVQRRRLRRKYGWSQTEVTARIRAQWDLAAKVALADHVVNNADGINATRTQVEHLWKHLERRNRKSSTSRR